MRKSVLFCILLTTAISFLAGCENTVKGFGEDMQNTGKKIQHSV